MTLDEFRQSLTATEAPAGLTHALAGLWLDAKSDWARAHDSSQRHCIKMRSFLATMGHLPSFNDASVAFTCSDVARTHRGSASFA